jgi:hypothetical protein
MDGFATGIVSSGLDGIVEHATTYAVAMTAVTTLNGKVTGPNISRTIFHQMKKTKPMTHSVNCNEPDR